MAAHLLDLPLEHPELPGAYRRVASRFRGTVEPQAPAGRYHLYVSPSCPWAHRTLIVRLLEGLEDAIGVTAAGPLRDEGGWCFHEPEPVNGFTFLAEAYRATDPDYDGRVSVPVLWDIEKRRIVNNESSEIVVQLDEAFGHLARTGIDLYPAELRAEIDAVNAVVFENVNDGVYQAGFARSQEAYEEAVDRIFACLDALEEWLSTRRYLVGGQLTLADVRLYSTLVRFDPVYHGHFKCNVRRVVDYPALWAYLRDLYQRPAFAETTDIEEIKLHYYASQTGINPRQIVAKGPALDLWEPHGRERLGA